MFVLLAVLLQATPVQVVRLHTETVDARQKLSIDAGGEWGRVSVEREDRDVVIALAAQPAPGLSVPAPAPPIEAIRVVTTEGGMQVRVSVAPDVPFEILRDGRRLHVLFGVADSAAKANLVNQRILDLYASLRPNEASVEDLNTPGDSGGEEERQPGFGVGPLRFQPSLLVGYARSETSLDEPTPVEDSYLQVEPRLGSQLTLWDGRIRGNYEPQIRMRSRFARINRASHEANLRAEIPFANRFVLRASEHYATSTLDTQEVDPGREYFFGLGRFSRYDTSGGLQIEIGPRLGLVVGAGLNRLTFHEETSFFSYDERHAEGGLEFMLTEVMRARLAYGYEEVPAPPERPLAASTSHAVGLSLSGEILPLVTGDFAIGYTDRRAPGAGEGGQQFRGLALSAQLAKDFARGSRLTLNAGRQTTLSAYEENAFYLSNSVQLALDLRVPLGFSGRVGGGYHWNAYRTVSSLLGEPRRDRMYGWTAGLSRPLRSWCYLRLDYGRDHRESNVPGLDNQSWTFLAQLGVGWFGSRTQ